MGVMKNSAYKHDSSYECGYSVGYYDRKNHDREKLLEYERKIIDYERALMDIECYCAKECTDIGGSIWDFDNRLKTPQACKAMIDGYKTIIEMVDKILRGDE